ncbi:hypothetical protein [Nocardia sp. NPDC050435]|uniref:hypothetical protein n=1 Tax=Nocardia sp. NPDC050435 TaxID=3155040 RepID=UPI0033EE9CF8
MTVFSRLDFRRALASDPVDTALPTRLHQLRTTGHPVTLTARGGHTLTGVRIDAVRRHHAVLAAGGGTVLMPLAFIETATPQPGRRLGWW